MIMLAEGRQTVALQEMDAQVNDRLWLAEFAIEDLTGLARYQVINRLRPVSVHVAGTHGRSLHGSVPGLISNWLIRQIWPLRPRIATR